MRWEIFKLLSTAKDSTKYEFYLMLGCDGFQKATYQYLMLSAYRRIEHYVIFRMKPWLWSTQYVSVSHTVEWCVLVEVPAQLVKSHYRYSQPSTFLASWDWWIPFCQSTACWVKHFIGNPSICHFVWSGFLRKRFWIPSWVDVLTDDSKRVNKDRSVLVPHPKRRKWNVNENQLWNI